MIQVAHEVLFGGRRLFPVSFSYLFVLIIYTVGMINMHTINTIGAFN